MGNRWTVSAPGAVPARDVTQQKEIADVVRRQALILSFRVEKAAYSYRRCLFLIFF